MSFHGFHLLNILTIVIVGTSAKRRTCDPEDHYKFNEGNLGQSSHFPWLGILKVHLHETNATRVALTGLVLIKKDFAIANANDINKIPLSVFRRHSSAMFVPNDNEPWYRNAKDYTTNPEYEYSTMNTIALIELETVDNEPIPFHPVCWPGERHVVSTANVYVLGYTDGENCAVLLDIDENFATAAAVTERRRLEKIAYKVTIIEKQMCEEYYNKRVGVTESKTAPVHYLCGFAPDNKDSCQWDNGMVLATNSTGKWLILGLGIKGPGCSAPGRFLDLSHYLSWVDTSSSINGYGFRKRFRID